MKTILKSIAFITLCSASMYSVAQTEAYQNCSTAGCHIAGSRAVISDYAKTKYPLVFSHGTAGYSSILGVLDYWHGIPQDLAANGAKVFVTQEAALNSSEVLGEQLLAQVDLVIAITGQNKVNLIGHSQGVQSARYVAAISPEKVASVTGVAGPIQGLVLADMASKIINLPGVNGLFNLAAPVLNALFSVLGIASGQYYTQDTAIALSSLTSEGAAKFNAKYPQAVPNTECGEGESIVNGVRYYSWTGIGKNTNLFDPSDYVLALSGTLIPGKSDGGVAQCSTHLGRVIRDDYNQNHLDEVNQIFGMVSILGANPVALYRQQANRLKLAGL